MKKTLIFLTALFLLVITNSCGFDKQWFAVDNPTNAPITISIDGGEAIAIEEKECKRLADISKGEHTLKMGDDEQSFTIETGIYLNPTQEIYVYVQVPYGAVSIPEESVKTITIDKKDYTGPFELFDGNLTLGHDKVNFGPDTPLKDVIESSGGGKIITKVFRKADFIKFYKEEY